MTHFQRMCIEKCNAIRDCFDFTEIIGKSEVYFLSEKEINGHNVVIYIYIDEAEFKINESWHIFEMQDYDNPDDLCTAFIEELEENLRNYR